jgi:hypothetical protein
MIEIGSRVRLNQSAIHAKVVGSRWPERTGTVVCISQNRGHRNVIHVIWDGNRGWSRYNEGFLEEANAHASHNRS